MKTFSQAPLPFQGQKRKFLKDFKSALDQFSSNATYVDLFGGSGFLSHTVKQHLPDAKVIYNDFDGYSYRLDNVENTNAILHDIREITKDLPDTVKITDEYKKRIIDRINQEPGFVDCITISSSLLFSMNYVTEKEAFTKQTFYNNVKQTDYVVDGYLDGVDRVKKDYRDLYAEFRNKRDVVFLLDPPYLSTDVSTYNKKDYWKLADYLNVLKCVEDSAYFYFTSNKSSIIELCEWISEAKVNANPFLNAVRKEMGAQLNYNSRYTDIMIYRR